jgi:hypothetical protein
MGGAGEARVELVVWSAYKTTRKYLESVRACARVRACVCACVRAQTAALCHAQQSNFVWFPFLCSGIFLGVTLALEWLRCCNLYTLV